MAIPAIDKHFIDSAAAVEHHHHLSEKHS